MIFQCHFPALLNLVVPHLRKILLYHYSKDLLPIDLLHRDMFEILSFISSLFNISLILSGLF